VYLEEGGGDDVWASHIIEMERGCTRSILEYMKIHTSVGEPQVVESVHNGISHV
jgi:hypothetical protein